MRRTLTLLSVAAALLVAVACGDDETSVAPSTSSASSSGAGGNGQQPSCADVCPQLIGAGCDASFTVSDCVSGCGDVIAGACSNFMKTFLLCADGATFSCNGDEAVATGCETEEQAIGTCEEQQGSGGGGQGSGGSGGS